MKTIFKTMTDQRKARQKQIEFEKKTNLKWDYYSTGNGMVFTPIVTNQTPLDQDAAKALIPHLTKDYQAFIKLSEISGLELSKVIAAAKTLAKQEKAVATVNRMGHFAAIRIK